MTVERIECLIEEIQQDARSCGSATGTSAFSPEILDAMRTIPRDAFVPEGMKKHAWENRPLPIGYNQTISQPFIVALMTALLDPKPADRVLEVGTGCGYQAAVLSLLVQEVYTVEVVEPLAKEATSRLKHYANVYAKAGDGYHGWKEHAPYQGIMVTAGAESVPPALIAQLAAPGRLVIPVTSHPGSMDLLVVEKSATGEISKHATIPVAFVPFTRLGNEA
mgnify:CR=1 FL=1